MSHRTMIDKLIKDGLIDTDHNLTEKGHEWVKMAKKKYIEETAKNMEKINAESDRESNASYSEKAPAG